MRIHTEIPFSQIDFLPDLTHEFVSEGDNFLFGKKLQLKEIEKSGLPSFDERNRDVVVEVLKQQYNRSHLPIPELVEKLRSKDVYTITTGHQLCLLGGPVYLVYKIASAIGYSRYLNEQLKSKEVVPIFWLASEDHDFDEVAVLHARGSTFNWKSGQSGAVGRMSAQGILSVVEELQKQYKEFKPDILNLPLPNRDETVADYYRRFVYWIFGDEIVVLDADDRELKKLFLPVAIKELDQVSFEALKPTNDKLRELGFNPQVNGREINLFWLTADNRTRILKDKAGYQFDGLVQNYSKPELIKLFQEHPECVSPNVVLRPVYQQMILPNLIYIGGGSEIAYWLQLKEVFSQFQVDYPVPQVRDSFIHLRSRTLKNWGKMGFSPMQVLQDSDQLKSKLAQKLGGLDLKATEKKLLSVMSEIEEETARIDRGLLAMVRAEAKRISNVTQKIEKKLIKSLKRQHEVEIKRIDNTIQEVFPHGVLQERYDSIFDHFSTTEEIRNLIQLTSPVNNTLKIVER